MPPGFFRNCCFFQAYAMLIITTSTAITFFNFSFTRYYIHYVEYPWWLVVLTVEVQCLHVYQDKSNYLIANSARGGSQREVITVDHLK